MSGYTTNVEWLNMDFVAAQNLSQKEIERSDRCFKKLREL